jgi:hypothetical protein
MEKFIYDFATKKPISKYRINIDRSEIGKRLYLYLKKAWLLTKLVSECVWNVNDLRFVQSNFNAQLSSFVTKRHC